MLHSAGYIETPGDDPVLVYQDITVAISIDPPSTTASHRCTRCAFRR